jgi:16S rRNA (cytidine1402-2'-O)-methyltransferase
MATGVLYVVATPIGNRGDWTPRAREVLGSVAAICCEDTRHSMPLLREAGIATSLIALHEHNERAQASQLVERLAAGDALALISDAGTPLISDPGYHLVRLARAAGVSVVPVPGACALVAALSVSGLPTDRFVFEGFLPARGAARRARLDELRTETRTLIFYESSHRIGEALADLAEGFGGVREAIFARELTKRFETVRAATLAELAAWVAEDADQRRGEIVLVVAGAAPVAEVGALDERTRATLGALLEELPLKQAVKLAARITGVARNSLYADAVARGRDGE